MTSPSPEGGQPAAEQFRMCRLQVFNWGTFSGLHDVPIAERGFLFVGRSGSGKSTLLDAFSALLVPPRWIDFNAAAREAERTGRDRNLASYVRGAWAEQKDDESGEIATRYLRSGTTWSALALSFKNGVGKTVVLVQAFWLRGNSNANTDVRRQYLIFERGFDLRELEAFDLDVRRLKQSFPEAFARDEFRPYCERFRRLLGIESESALKLLHKTQSAKSLGDLNSFLRDFMLDKPETFVAADRLVAEFAELNAAHLAVVTAREQRATLVPAREKHEVLQDLKLKQNGLDELRVGVDGFKEIRRKDLLELRIASLEVDGRGWRGEVERREALHERQSQDLRDLEAQHRDAGGDRIEQWQAEKQGLEQDRADMLRKQGTVQEACRQLDWRVPDSPQSLAELAAEARQEIEDGPAQRKLSQSQRTVLDNQKADKEREFVDSVAEVAVLRRQPSNIPAQMIELRAHIAGKLGLAEAALPFVGELLEVIPSEAEWRGAIERVLHGFALSLLVDERYYSAVSGFVNEAHLGGRLVYFRVGKGESVSRHIPANSLINKLSIKDCDYSPWLEAELRQRFDYACVESVQAFRSTERALTREGQVRHGKTRHEKNDRYAIDDRSQWVLGFDNRDKLALFEERAQKLAASIEELKARISTLVDAGEVRDRRALFCQTLANIQWREIDLLPVLDRIAAIERELAEAREGNSALQDLGQRIVFQKDKVKQAADSLVEAQTQVKLLSKELGEMQERFGRLRDELDLITLTPFQSISLGERLTALNQPVMLDSLDRLANLVERGLAKEWDAVRGEQTSAMRAIEDRFAEFKRTWPNEAADMDATVASAPDFFNLLKRIETDGLPAYEHKFFDLLRNQSHQNLAALSTHINHARKTILERMELVNESLSQAPFNPDTTLHIDATDRQLPEVREFKQEIHQALSHAWTEDREQAENRFLVLRGLVERLSSQDAEKRRWRELVLDVRQHVEFIGREIDRDGREVEVYRSGAGKSGGQRQKLATTCLAAALRYQLGGNDQGVPMYAPVVLDEAFDKADNEFTALAMNIFANFGFQMIVATPLKSVMTLEPFIGGACFVDISDRKVSGVLMIEYDSERQRLKLPDQARGDASVAVS